LKSLYLFLFELKLFPECGLYGLTMVYMVSAYEPLSGDFAV